VNQVLVTGPEPAYSGFVELTEASWRLARHRHRAGGHDPGRRRHAATLDPAFVVDSV
jgi:hypothetical protein